MKMMTEEFITSYEDQIRNEKTLYHWSCIGPVIDKKEYWIRWGAGIAAGLPDIIVSVFLFIDEAPYYFHLVGLLPAVMMILAARYLFLPDFYFHYYVKESGIHYTKKEKIPDVAYKVVRIIAWAGIVICIIAGFMLGPMVFAGAGAFALMSFGMTNFHPETKSFYIFISPPTLIFNQRDEFHIDIKSITEKDHLYINLLNFQSINQKNNVIADLCDILKDVELININNKNERLQHPIYEKHRKEHEEEYRKEREEAENNKNSLW